MMRYEPVRLDSSSSRPFRLNFQAQNTDCIITVINSRRLRCENMQHAWDRQKCIENLVGKIVGKGYLWNPVVGGWKIRKLFFEKYSVKIRIASQHKCMTYISCCICRVIRNDCRGFNNLPPPSPNATPCDFFLCGYVKHQIYVPPVPASIPELPLKPSRLTCYKQFGTNSIIVLIFVESQRVHI